MNPGTFAKGDARARELGRRGALAKRAKDRATRGLVAPLGGSILDLAAALNVFQGASWANWWAFLKGLFALPLTAAELRTFRDHTGRDRPPGAPVSEGWVVVGRRGGKSRIAAFVATYLAAARDYRASFAPGERGVVMVVAADRRQAAIVLRYLKALFTLPPLAPLVAARRVEALELRTGVTIEVHAASYRTVRGFTLVGAILDEVAFWPTDEASAEPDSAILAAVRPGMATVPGAVLLALSTPYARRGELWRAVERSYGQPDPQVLVWRGATRAMNPEVPDALVTQALERDPAAAASEYLAEFRSDVQSFLDPEAVRAVTVSDRRELPPVPGVSYVAFVDPSGGAQDSFTLAIAHTEPGPGDGQAVAILDALREVRPPFSPDAVVGELAGLLRAYRLWSVTGDRYGGAWPQERFGAHNLDYRPAERTKSELYRELLPLVNAGRVQLLDWPRLRAQLLGLERRVARGGKDSVDHAPLAHDDLANAAAGALVGALQGAQRYPDFSALWF